MKLSKFLFEKVLMLLVLFLGLSVSSIAQPPSHDPTYMVRAANGRYWIYTTGNGIWAMSSSNSNFTDWRAEPTPIPAGTWPSWINSAVPGFNGHFWAPGIVHMNGSYYLYYSASTFGSSRSAIGVLRSGSISSPNWTDLGMVVSSNGSSSAINAIDPEVFVDTNGRAWMVYGSFFGGIGIVEVNPSTGKTIGSVTRIAGGNHQDIEAPYLLKNGNYYYLFVNRGSCCNGVNSTYYIQVARSTSVTGPYSGWRTILGNEGRYIGPGHIGYGEGKLTYHFYDGNDNGSPKLRVTTLGWSNGWPVVHGSGGGDGGGGGGGGGGGSYIQLRNRGTNLYLDGMGRTANGEAVGQWASTNHVNSHWERIDVGSGYFQLRNRGTGLFLDGMGRTTNGEDCGQWGSTSHQNSHWAIQQYSGSYYRIQNRGTGLYLDGMGRTTNGDACGQWASTTHVNSQWQVINVSARMGSELTEEVASDVLLYPNPVRENEAVTITMPSLTDQVDLEIVDLSGRMIFAGQYHAVDEIKVGADLGKGVYMIRISADGLNTTHKLIVR